MSRNQWPDTINVKDTFNVSRADLMRRRAVAEDLNRRYEWKTGRPRRQRIVLVLLSIMVGVGLYLLERAS